MENASKALIIAGEVLIGVIILSILAFTFQRVYTFSESYKDNRERQEIIKFNTEYTKYITKTGSQESYIYSEDVVTLTEQVLNWNKSIEVESEQIELSILNKARGEIYTTKTPIPEFDRKEFMTKYKLTGDPDQNNKEYKFSCSMEVDENSGRVNKIVIQIQGVRD